jgi:hypothetical protein
LWWNGERWKAPGPFGRLTMPVDQAVDYIASEPVPKRVEWPRCL